MPISKARSRVGKIFMASAVLIPAFGVVLSLIFGNVFGMDIHVDWVKQSRWLLFFPALLGLGYLLNRGENL